MHYRKITGVLFLLLIFSVSYLANAQETTPDTQEAPKVEISDKELSKFINAVNKVSKIQHEAQEKAIKTIADEGLDPNRFDQIAQYKRNPESYSGTKITGEELESFDKAEKKIESIQIDLETKAKKAIEDEGMDVQKYIQIAQASQQDPDLQKRIKEKLTEKE